MNIFSICILLSEWNIKPSSDDIIEILTIDKLHWENGTLSEGCMRVFVNPVFPAFLHSPPTVARPTTHPKSLKTFIYRIFSRFFLLTFLKCLWSEIKSLKGKIWWFGVWTYIIIFILWNKNVQSYLYVSKCARQKAEVSSLENWERTTPKHNKLLEVSPT